MPSLQNNLKQQAITGTKWMSISTVSISLAQVIQLIILAKLLKPSDFGLMGMSTVVIGFASAFADMGISNAIIYRQDNTKEKLSSLYWLNVFTGFLVFLILWVSSPLIAELYHEHRLTNLLLLTAAVFPIIAFGQQFQILLQKELKFYNLSKIEIISVFMGCLVTIYTAFYKQGVYSLIWGQIANALCKTVLLYIYGHNISPIQLHFNRKDLKDYLSFGIYQMGERTLNYTTSNLDFILIGSFLGAKALGYYVFAYNLIIVPMNKISPIITRVTFPIFAKIQDDIQYLKKGYLKTLKLISFINFPIYLGLAITANSLILTFFGSKWVPSVLLLQILVGVGLLRAIANPVGSLLMARGRADLGFIINLIFLLFQIPGIYLGLHYGKTVGVAISFLILQMIYFFISYYIVIKELLGPCFLEYVYNLWIPFRISGLMALTIWFLGEIVHVNFSLLLLFQIVIAILFYINFVYFFERNFYLEIKEMFYMAFRIK